MGTPNMTLKDKASIVAEMLPGHTLDLHGKVVPAPVCPLCGSPRLQRTGFLYLANDRKRQRYICPSCRNITLGEVQNNG